VSAFEKVTTGSAETRSIGEINQKGNEETNAVF